MGNMIVVPYSGHLPGGIQVGTEVFITGRPTPSFSTFSINLCVGPNLEGDCAFHFNPRFDEGVVVRNHKQAGNWGHEERAGRMPFRRSHIFNMSMKVLSHCYKVTVNNQHYCDFNHRLPKESVSYIYIKGDVNIDKLEVRGGVMPVPNIPSVPQPPTQPYPTAVVCPPGTGMSAPAGYAPPPYTPSPGYPPAPAYPSTPGYPQPPTSAFPPAPGYPHSSAPAYPQPPAQGYPPAPGYSQPSAPAGFASNGPFYNPAMPFKAAIPGGLYPGKVIFIAGTVHPNPSRFNVNIACGPLDSADLGLHFDARFKYGNDRHQVIRTHKQNGKYGHEERHINYFPFTTNAQFQIMILAEPQSYKIAVNGQHFTEFAHRIHPLNRFDHVIVNGDVTLTELRFQS